MMFYEFLRGVRVEVEENGFAVISNSGKKTYFDESGNRICDSDHIEEMEERVYPNHFDFMGTSERNLVNSWYYRQKARTSKQAAFLDIVGKAIRMIGYDYCIANLEPSSDENGELYYEEGEVVAEDLSSYQWMEKAKAFSTKYKSELASLYELFLWYAWRIAKGYWTLEYVCDDSSSKGNYCNSPDSHSCFELSGAREVGGRYDGTGNTYKLVMGEGCFVLCGGYWGSAGFYCPVAEVFSSFVPNAPLNNASGVVVLKRV